MQLPDDESIALIASAAFSALPSCIMPIITLIAITPMIRPASKTGTDICCHLLTESTTCRCTVYCPCCNLAIHCCITAWDTRIITDVVHPNTHCIPAVMVPLTKLDPFLESCHHCCSCQQDEDEHVVQLTPQLCKESRLLGWGQCIRTIPADGKEAEYCATLSVQLLLE